MYPPHAIIIKNFNRRLFDFDNFKYKLVTETKEELYRRYIVRGVHHVTNIIDMIEAIYLDMTEIILEKTGVRIDADYSTK